MLGSSNTDSWSIKYRRIVRDSHRRCLCGKFEWRQRFVGGVYIRGFILSVSVGHVEGPGRKDCLLTARPRDLVRVRRLDSFVLTPAQKLQWKV
jgi:hypothetical protein